jgi:hypothetical protein
VADQSNLDRPWGWGILIGFPLFMTGGMLILTVIGAPLGILMFAAGLGLMLTPRPEKGGR